MKGRKARRILKLGATLTCTALPRPTHWTRTALALTLAALALTLARRRTRWTIASALRTPLPLAALLRRRRSGLLGGHRGCLNTAYRWFFDCL